MSQSLRRYLLRLSIEKPARQVQSVLGVNNSDDRLLRRRAELVWIDLMQILNDGTEYPGIVIKDSVDNWSFIDLKRVDNLAL